MPARVVQNERGLRRLMMDPHGGIAREMGKRAVRVRNAAVLNATGRQVVGATNPEGRGPRVDTGRLRSSIAWALVTDSGGVFARVGTNVRYGYYLETGLRNGVTYPFLKPALPAARL